jgi:cytochrome oxidase Cu insertion factor (SCO1/SenC/PrrC family)
MNRFMRVLLGAAIAGLVCAGALVVVWLTSRPGAEALRPPEGFPDLRFPEFTMTDQDGRPFTRRDLEGQVTIVGFMFSHCPLACPGMMVQLGKHYAALKDQNVRFLTISLDPARDTPARLKEWGTEYRADGQRWRLLTGEEGLSRKILRQNLKMLAEEDEKLKIGLPDGSTMNNIIHPPHLFLIGPEGQVLGFFNYQQPEEMAELQSRARKAARALP